MGKSASAPAPDPKLVDAQIAGLDQQDRIGRRQLEIADELRPTQRAAIDFGLESGRKAYEQTQEDRQYALGKRDQYDAALTPLINEAEQFDEAVRRNELATRAAADISANFDVAQRQQERGLARTGALPSSGRSVMAMQQGELAEAAARSRAGLLVSEAARAEGLQLKSNVVNQLRGAPTQAASLTPIGAALGAGGIDAVNAGAGGISQGLTDAGRAAGAAGGAAGDAWRGQADGYYRGLAADSAAESEIIGSGLGLAAMGGYKGYKNYKASGGKSVFAA